MLYKMDLMNRKNIIKRTTTFKQNNYSHNTEKESMKCNTKNLSGLEETSANIYTFSFCVAMSFQQKKKCENFFWSLCLPCKQHAHNAGKSVYSHLN